MANGAAPANQPYAQAAGDAAVDAARRGDLTLSNVSFSYPARAEARVLSDVSLSLRHGSVTALVGRSGAGKSTVAALLSRFYEPQARGETRAAFACRRRRLLHLCARARFCWPAAASCRPPARSLHPKPPTHHPNNPLPK